MRAPRPGESVYLLCMNCKHSFLGPCPDRFGLSELTNKKIQTSKCPKCNSIRVMLSPFVKY